MDKNFTMEINYTGSAAPRVQAVPMQEGYVKVGGIVDESMTNGLKFGTVATWGSDNKMKTTGLSPTSIAGIVIYDDSIGSNAPAHSGKYLAGLPCAVLVKGVVQIDLSIIEADNPSVGESIVYTSAGVLGTGTSAPSGGGIFAGSKVLQVNEKFVLAMI